MTVPVRILDQGFKLLGEIDNYTSLIFSRKWHHVGEFTISINLNKRNTEKLLKNNYIMLGADPEKVGVITGREIDYKAEGEPLQITGVPLSGIMARRIVLPTAGEEPETFSSTPAETIMRTLVGRNAINPSRISRKIDDLYQEATQDRGEVLDYQAALTPLDEELEALSLYSGLGWDVTFDKQGKRLLFRILEGVDRTFGNPANAPAVFDPDRDNLNTQSFIDTFNNYNNLIYMGGAGTGSSQVIEPVWDSDEEPSGLDRWETFADAKDLTTAELDSKGKQLLKETPGELSLQGEISSRSNLRLGRDFNLGDMVTIQNRKWGVRLDTRIVEVVEAWTNEGYKVECQFGTSTPTLYSVLKTQIRKYS